MTHNGDINIERLFADIPGLDKEIYRSKVRYKQKYNWRILYKYSDILISCDTDISLRLEKSIKEIYCLLETRIKEDPAFQKSLSPLKSKPGYHAIIKEMYRKTAIFNVGPMAAVAGAVCDYMANSLGSRCRCLIIENGGDVFIKSNEDTDVGVYLNSKYFADKIYLKVKAADTPCGLCSSSGSFGHSLSMGKSDLVVVMAKSTVTSDGAATAIANNINSKRDIFKTISNYKNIKDITGILIIKDDKLGIWGNIELTKS